MLSETLRNLLAKYKMIVHCNDVKKYKQLEERRLTQIKLDKLRLNRLRRVVRQLNCIVTDKTFKFVITDYVNFYTVQLFEGDGELNQDCVIIGNSKKANNLLLEIPMRRKTILNMNGVKAYILAYNNYFISLEHEFANMSPAQLMVKTQFVEVKNSDIVYQASAAVRFDAEMIRYWNKYKLLPTVKELVNGKRYNRTRHQQKLIDALEKGNIINEEETFVVYWA